ncbi:MAG: hypothetical protein NUV51_06030, partial [Sulfuricaulis sp.]|nr:hypothetical protein [Sulfuricaulis sp.]
MRIHPLAGLETLERRILIVGHELEVAAGGVLARAHHPAARVNGGNGAANFICGGCGERIFCRQRTLAAQRRSFHARCRRRPVNNRVTSIYAHDRDLARG